MLRQLFSLDNEAYHELSGGEALANQHMSDESFASHFIVRSDMILKHEVTDCFENQLVFRRPEKAILAWNHGMCSTGIEAHDDVAALILGNWKLRFVTITKGIFHPYDWLENCL